MSETDEDKKSQKALVSERLKFQWLQEVPQYGDKLLRRLDDFRKKSMFYDVTLKTSGADLAAHKVVLAACGGMFRSHFIDPKTKKILGDVSEVSFACPAAGLQPILKFAYSGVLEITEENLLPTYLAAAVTEMKEVQEICANIAMSRLAWVVDFDGSEDTIPYLNAENKIAEEKTETDPSLEGTFSLLHRLLELNFTSFSSESEIHETNEILKSENDENIDCLCLEEVEKRWPKYTSTYKAIVKCLLRIKPPKSPKNEKEATAAEPINAIAHQQDKKQATMVDNDITSGHDISAEANNADSKHVAADETSVKESEPVNSSTESNAEKTSAAVESTPAVSASKPTTKPRTVSVTKDSHIIAYGNAKIPPTAHKRQSSMESSQVIDTPMAKNGNAEIPPTAHKRQSSMESSKVIDTPMAKIPPTVHKRQNSSGTAAVHSNQTPQKPIAPTPSASSGPRKKHAAPKPPGPPPNSSLKSPASKVSSSPQGSPLRTKSAPKTANGTPGSASKPVPPRPKPPSIKKNKPNRDSGAHYDDALNPFADDENDTVSDRSTNYDESLNPFG